MGKILYYTWIAIGIVIGLPVVLLILIGTWAHKKYHEITCKRCKTKNN